MNGFFKDLSRSFWETLKIRHVPEIYMSLGFFILSAVTSPSFGEFSFYYNTNVRHVSKSALGVLDTLGSLSYLFGVMLYGMYFKEWEFRKLILYSTAIGLVGSALDLCYILKYTQNVGLPDEIYLGITSVVFGALGMAMQILPLQILFVKITPKSIEGTCYAVFVGIENFSNSILSPLIGSWLNDKYFHVTEESMLRPNDSGFLEINIV